MFWLKASLLRTSNQYLSLTDQLRMGVRLLELDVHFVLGELRIAHCGGVDLKVAPLFFVDFDVQILTKMRTFQGR